MKMGNTPRFYFFQKVNFSFLGLYYGRFCYLPHILDVSIHCSHTAWFGRHSLFMTFPPIVAVTTWFRCHYLIYMGLVVSFRGRGTEKEHLKFLITRKSMQPSPVAYSLSRFLWHVATRRTAILRFCAVLCSMGSSFMVACYHSLPFPTHPTHPTSILLAFSDSSLVRIHTPGGGGGERHSESKVLCPRTQHIDLATCQTQVSWPGNPTCQPLGHYVSHTRYLIQG